MQLLTRRKPIRSMQIYIITFATRGYDKVDEPPGTSQAPLSPGESGRTCWRRLCRFGNATASGFTDNNLGCFHSGLDKNKNKTKKTHNFTKRAMGCSMHINWNGGKETN